MCLHKNKTILSFNNTNTSVVNGIIVCAEVHVWFVNYTSDKTYGKYMTSSIPQLFNSCVVRCINK